MWGQEGKVLAAWLSLPLGLDSGHHPGTEQLVTVVPSTPILSSPLGPWLSAPLSQEFVASRVSPLTGSNIIQLGFLKLAGCLLRG